MYPLGKQFKIDLEKSKSTEKCIVKGDKYRFTVLSERLIRLEYNVNGNFVDKPSQFVLYRSFEYPNYQVKQDNKLLETLTSSLIILPFIFQASG